MIAFLKNLAQNVSNFCGDVVRWRSICTIPYVMAINFAFCAVSFYALPENQIYALYALIGFVISTDLLFSSTGNSSLMHEIVCWPIADFFKTSCVALCSLAIYELKNDKKEEAFASAGIAVLSIVINPVYKFHNVNEKILSLFGRLGSTLKYFFMNYVVFPFVYVFQWMKYILLFQWMPVLFNYLRDCWRRVWMKFDSLVLTRIRALGCRLMEIFRYWVYFHWWTDLSRWSKRVIFNPLLEKLTKVFNGFVYIVGCYWLVPILKRFGSFCAEMGKRALGVFRELLILFGINVVQPIFGLILAQLYVALRHFYAIAIQPIVDLCYKKYKFVEDLAFIYVLGPVFKKLIDSMPEKNPFAENSDAELSEYLPSSRLMDESGAESDSSLKSLGSLASDEREFIPHGLNRVDISGSDFSDAEFSLAPIRRSKRKPRNAVDVSSRLSDLTFDDDLH